MTEAYHLYAVDLDAIRGTVRIQQDPLGKDGVMEVRVSNNYRTWSFHALGRDMQAALRTAMANDQEVTVRLEPETSGGYRRISSVEDVGPNSMRAAHEALVTELGVTPSRYIPRP